MTTAQDLKQSRKLRLKGISEGKVLTGPQTVHIDLANGCNTNCTTCWDHSPHLHEARSIDWKRQKMSLDVFEKLVEDLDSMRSVESVILSGMGDPFVNTAIYQMIALCKEKNWHVTVLTNALLAQPEKILALDVDMMLISVNGVSPASYTAFHPNLDHKDFAHLCSLLDIFSTAGKNFKHVQVINRDTAPELVEMVQFASKYKAKSITYKLASLREGTEACAITEEQRTQLLEKFIPEAKREAARLQVETNLEVFEKQVLSGGRDTAPIKDVGCFMGWTYARVTVDGTILFCCSTEVNVGDLARGDFSSQWSGELWNSVRSRLMAGRYFPNCAQCGKLNQNVKIGEKVKVSFGEEVFLTRIGKGPRKLFTV
jgi:MoaA/NifB/PqqE/SkfB family radical SAM enzyme